MTGNLNWDKVCLIKSRSYLCTGKFAHHEVGVFKSVVIVIVIAGRWNALGPKCAPAGAPTVVLRVKRIHDNGLCTLNLTATEGTSCSLTL